MHQLITDHLLCHIQALGTGKEEKKRGSLISLTVFLAYGHLFTPLFMSPHLFIIAKKYQVKLTARNRILKLRPQNTELLVVWDHSAQGQTASDLSISFFSDPEY